MCRACLQQGEARSTAREAAKRSVIENTTHISDRTAKTSQYRPNSAFFVCEYVLITYRTAEDHIGVHERQKHPRHLTRVGSRQGDSSQDRQSAGSTRGH